MASWTRKQREQNAREWPRIYFAGANTRWMLEQMPCGIPQLESFADRSHRGVINGYRHLQWALDCGAFTVYNQGGRIDLVEYADYVQQFDYEWYLSVDVIDGGEAINAKNYDKLLSWGLKPVPVWHEGESIELLRDYLFELQKQRDPMIAIGAQWPRNKKRVRHFLRRAFTLLSSHYTWLWLRVHGLACVQFGDEFAFSSVDSRYWASAIAKLKLPPWHYLPFGLKCEMYIEATRAKWEADHIEESKRPQQQELAL